MNIEGILKKTIFPALWLFIKLNQPHVWLPTIDHDCIHLWKNESGIIEPSAISYYKTIQERPGFYRISPYPTQMILKYFSLHKQRKLNEDLSTFLLNTLIPSVHLIYPFLHALSFSIFFSLGLISSLFPLTFSFLLRQYKPTFHRRCLFSKTFEKNLYFMA